MIDSSRLSCEWRRWLIAGIAAMSTTARAQSTAFEAECAREAARTVVDLHFEPGGISLELDRDTTALTSMKSLGGRWITSGLTLATQRFRIRHQVRVLLADDDQDRAHDPAHGHGCALPHFDVTVTLLPQQVWIGREFMRGTCSFDAILAHEMRHVEANREHALRVARAFQSRLREAYAHAPVHGDAATLNTRIARSMEHDWMPRLKADLEQADKQQSAIDSEAEFERLSHACGGEIATTAVFQASR